MKPHLVVSLFSAASWECPDMWASVFDSLAEHLFVAIRYINRYRPDERRRRCFRNNLEAGALVSEFHKRKGLPDISHCYIEFGKGVSADVHFPSIEQLSDQDTKFIRKFYGAFALFIEYDEPDQTYITKKAFSVFEPLSNLLKAFWGELESGSIFQAEQVNCCSRYNLTREFPTLACYNYFSDTVVDFFGREKFFSIPCEVHEWTNGLCTKFGEAPNVADINRFDKIRAEEILGAESFSIPETFPKQNYLDFDLTQKMRLADPNFRIPKMRNGEPKPEFKFVPPFWLLAEEFEQS